MTSYSDYIYWNNHVQTYGNAIKIDSWLVKLVVFIIAALPLGTAWMFPLIPKMKEIKFRY